jgi:hypothetical protein
MQRRYEVKPTNPVYCDGPKRSAVNAYAPRRVSKLYQCSIKIDPLATLERNGATPEFIEMAHRAIVNVVGAVNSGIIDVLFHPGKTPSVFAHNVRRQVVWHMQSKYKVYIIAQCFGYTMELTRVLIASERARREMLK